MPNRANRKQRSNPKSFLGGRRPEFDGKTIGFPEVREVELLYSQYVAMSCTSGLMSSYIWRLNSLFDPDYSGTGHQPLGFDQWAAFYGSYTVTKCDWELQIVGDQTPAAFRAVAAVSKSPAAVATDIDEAIENGGDLRLLGAYKVPVSGVVKGTTHIGRYLNRKGDLNLDDNLRALTSASPTDVPVLAVLGQSTSANSSTLYICVKLIYTVTFSNPLTLAAS